MQDDQGSSEGRIPEDSGSEASGADRERDPSDPASPEQAAGGSVEPRPAQHPADPGSSEPGRPLPFHGGSGYGGSGYGSPGSDHGHGLLGGGFVQPDPGSARPDPGHSQPGPGYWLPGGYAGQPYGYGGQGTGED